MTTVPTRADHPRGPWRPRPQLLAVGFFALVAAGQAAAAPPPAVAPRHLAVGAEVPTFSLPTVDGGSASLAERRAVGPTVLVFFRGVW